MNVKFDYNEKTQKCNLSVSDNDVKDRLLNAFSMPNEGKKFVKGPARAWVQDRIYFIKPTGAFNFRYC